MKQRNTWLLAFVTFFAMLSVSLAASPTSFCKCTCGGNSTIVPLDGPATTSKPAAFHFEERAAKKSCTDCNRSYCLSYPFCKDAKEEEVFTTCFQRDSAKDQAVVFIFIIATVGLLSYAGIRPWIDQWAERTRERRSYIPVSGQADQ